MNKQMLLGVVLLLAALTPLLYSAEPEIKASEGRQAEWVLKSLSQHMLSISRGQETVRFRSDGEFGVTRSAAWQDEFELKPGDSFRAAPDHHAGLEIKIIKIEAAGGSVLP